MHRTFAEPLKACCCLQIVFSIRLIAYFGFLYSSLLLQLLFVALWCSELLIRCWHRFLLPKMRPKCPPGPPQTPPGHPKTLSEWPLGLPKTTLSGVLDHLWDDVRCWSCIFCIFLNFLNVLDPTWLHLGSQNGTKTDPKSIKLRERNLGAEKLPRKSALEPFLFDFHAWLSFKIVLPPRENTLFWKFTFFTSNFVKSPFWTDFPSQNGSKKLPFWHPRRSKKQHVFWIDFWMRSKPAWIKSACRPAELLCYVLVQTRD